MQWCMYCVYFEYFNTLCQVSKSLILDSLEIQKQKQKNSVQRKKYLSVVFAGDQ